MNGIVTPLARTRRPFSVVRIIAWTIAALLVVAAAGYIAFLVSPRPSAWVAAYGFDRRADKLAQSLAKHVPAGIEAERNLPYDTADRDATLDVFYPATLVGTTRVLPTVVWIHGGGWISGTKEQIASYLEVLASRGFTVVGVEYSHAPRRTYPTPLRQTNAALAYLDQHAGRLHIDRAHLFLAGDSSGAHIAVQLANLISLRMYSVLVDVAPSIQRSQLAGVVLYGGLFDLEPHGESSYSRLIDTMLWSYTGQRDYARSSIMAQLSVASYVTATFPPTFISAGNRDPVLGQSRTFADALASHGVPVERLFFPDNTAPGLPHEYQFNLDRDAGRLALDRSVAFLSGK